MKTVSDYCREQFGEKAYRLSLDGGFTCPNRDGTLDTRGCIFCSAGGSGDFAERTCGDISRQLENAKKQVSLKYAGHSYIAYFQAFTNTYAPISRLRELYYAAIKPDDIVCLSVATRPDCLSDGVLALLSEINAIKPVWVELGLQTANDKTAEYIRRGYKTEVYDAAVKKLNAIGVHVITHVILCLPGETEADMLRTVRHAIDAGTGGMKLQMLHVLKGTDIAKDYEQGKFSLPELDEYASLVSDCVDIIPNNVVIHRITGDGPKKLLIAPLWSGDKKRVLNTINRELKARGLI